MPRRPTVTPSRPWRRQPRSERTWQISSSRGPGARRRRSSTLPRQRPPVLRPQRHTLQPLGLRASWSIRRGSGPRLRRLRQRRPGVPRRSGWRRSAGSASRPRRWLEPLSLAQPAGSWRASCTKRTWSWAKSGLPAPTAPRTPRPRPRPQRSGPVPRNGSGLLGPKSCGASRQPRPWQASVPRRRRARWRRCGSSCSAGTQVPASLRRTLQS
mmetsp:Transcript_71195/g.230461  ORF Transcript_71195/g.230461 Transcript_71195/m.230461 type:complete len:212 (-) Transcript_71195:909-1544(-)